MSRSVTPPYDQLRALEGIRIVPPAKATAVVTEDGITYMTVELTEEQTAFIRESTLAPQFSIREESE